MCTACTVCTTRIGVAAPPFGVTDALLFDELDGLSHAIDKYGVRVFLSAMTTEIPTLTGAGLGLRAGHTLSTPSNGESPLELVRGVGERVDTRSSLSDMSSSVIVFHAVTSDGCGGLRTVASGLGDLDGAYAVLPIFGACFERNDTHGDFGWRSLVQRAYVYERVCCE